MSERRKTVAVVLPCYRVAGVIEGVVRSLPPWVTHVIAVDDCCPEGTGAVLDRLDGEFARLTVVHHEQNQGVGGAMVTGFRTALDLGADLVVKMDGDGQMATEHLPALLQPLLDGRADYSKGNRFRDVRELSRMPAMRLVGNVGLSFLTKLASGYWYVFDPQNGYLAITREALARLPLDSIDRSYFFENSMLVHLNIEGAAIADVPMPAIYGDEPSSLSVTRTLFAFPPKLLRMTLKRFFVRYLIYEVSPLAMYVLFGGLCLAFSLVFGGYHWWRSIETATPATTGTVVLALLPFLVGFQLWLHALNLDITLAPRVRPPLRQIELDEIADSLAPVETAA